MTEVSVVAGVIAALSFANGPTSQNTLSISAPVSVRAEAQLTVTMQYTAIEDDGLPASLFFGVQETTAPCAADVTQSSTFALIWNPAMSVSGTGAAPYKAAADFAPGPVRFCAWLTDLEGNLLAGPATALVQVTALPPPPPELSFLGHTSNGQLFTLGVQNKVVLGFRFHAVLPCSGTNPATTAVDLGPHLVQGLKLPISSSGAFRGVAKLAPGEEASINGRFQGTRLSGLLTDVLHPTAANRIRLDAPPHSLILGGTCRQTLRFSATLSR